MHAGSVEVLSIRGSPADTVLSVAGELILAETTALKATARNGAGKRSVSDSIEIAAEEAWPAGAAGLQAYPLATWTSPTRSRRTHFRLRTDRDVADTLLVVLGQGYRAIPQEFPLVLRSGDRTTLTLELVVPDRREFPASCPLSLVAGTSTVWQGSLLVCPWEIDRFKPEGAPLLGTHNERIGFVARNLRLRTATPCAAARTLVAECFTEGFQDSTLRVRVSRPIPRVPLTLTKALPTRRAWHTLAFDLGGMPIARGRRIEVDATSRGTVLLGGIRILER